MAEIFDKKEEIFLTRAQYNSRQSSGTLVAGSIYHITDDPTPEDIIEGPETAYKATRDGDGNVITSTYEPLLPETPLNPENKFLNGNKAWSEILIGSGDNAANVYLTDLDSITVPLYKKLSYTNEASPVEISSIVNNEEVLVETYLFDAPVSITQIDSGLWFFSFYAKVNSIIDGNSFLKIEVFKYSSAAVETTLFSKTSQIISDTSYIKLNFEINQPIFTIDSTDQLGCRVYVSTTSVVNRTITYILGGNNPSYVKTPLALRHNQLRGLDEDENYQHISLTEKTKLSGIEIGAEANVQSDWSDNDPGHDAFIKNKPTLFSGDYGDLINTPTIPSDVSELTDDTNLIPSPEEVASKADKVVSATSGNLASLNEYGNLVDSGVSVESLGGYTHDQSTASAE